MAFLHQLKVLLWKNWLSVYRQPVWSVVLVLWPVVIFFILAMTRTQFSATRKSVCYLAPRNLQSTGMIPFLQTFLCDNDTKCRTTSYVPYKPTNLGQRSRLKKRSVDSGGGDSFFQVTSLNGSSIVETNLISVLKQTIVNDSLQNIFQELPNKFITPQINITDIFSVINSINTNIKVVQNNTDLWNFLWMIPEWIKNPERLPNTDEFNMIISAIPNLQTCVNYMLTISRQVQNSSSTSRIMESLQMLSEQCLNSDIQSLVQQVLCGSSQCQLQVGQTLETIYWLVTSLKNETSNTTCEMNGLNITCKVSITLNSVLQKSIALVKQFSVGPLAGQTSVLNTTFGQMILQKLEQRIINNTSLDSHLQSVLKQLVQLLLNTTDILITSSTTEQFYIDLLALLEQINSLVLPQLKNQLQNLDGGDAISDLTQNIIKNWMNITSSNLISQTFVDLQTIINYLSTVNSEIATLNDTSALIKILSIFNQPAFNNLQSTLQTLLGSNPINSNITTTLTHALIVFSEVMSGSSLTNSSVFANFYLNQILNLLNTDTKLQTELAFLNTYFNNSQLDFLQSGGFSSYAENVLTFFTPSNLQAVSSNPNNASLGLLKLVSGIIPPSEKEIFHKVENVFTTLYNLVLTCDVESKCTDSIIVFQQELTNASYLITNLTSGNIQQVVDNDNTLQFVPLSISEAAVIDNIFLIIVCSQAANNSSCNTTQGIYKKTIEELSLIENITLGGASKLLSNLTLTQQLKQNVDYVLQVLGSVDLNNLTSQLTNLTKLSKCYVDTKVNPLQCTMDLNVGLMDLLQTLAFPQPINKVLLVMSSITKHWCAELNGTTDIYQQLTNLYNWTDFAFHNQSILQEINTNVLDIIKSLEELKVNLSSVTTVQLIRNLLETLKFSNSNYTLPTTLLSQTNQELEYIKSQLQTVQWYVQYVTNQTEALQTSGNIYPFVTMTQMVIGNVLASMKSNPSLVVFADEAQYVINLLEKSSIIPSLLSLINETMQGGDQSMDTFINHTLWLLVNGTGGNPLLNEITANGITFVLQLLQKYDGESLANLSSGLLLTEKVLLTVKTLVNDLELTASNFSLQTIYNISVEVMSILYNVELEGNMNSSVLYNIYNLLLKHWNGTIFQEFPLLQNKLMDLLNLSMQCSSERINQSLNQNCSLTDIMHTVKLILNDFGCQANLVLPVTNGNITFNSILDYVMNSTWQRNMSGCAIESATIRKELACLSKELHTTVQLIFRTKYPLGENISWVSEMDRALTLVSEKLSAQNISCATNDSQIGYIVYQVLQNQSTHLNSLISLFFNNTLYTPDVSQYSEYLDQVANLLKLYMSAQGNTHSSNSVLNILNNTLLDTIYSFLTSVDENLNEKDPQMNFIVFQILNESVNTLQSNIKEALLSGKNSPVVTEKIAISVMGAVNSILRSLNITSYDVIGFTSEIFHTYFDMKNSTLPTERLAQKILAHILTVFQNGGLENVFVQSLQSQIINLSSEKQDIIQNFVNIVFSAINETASESATQTPSYNNNLIFNIVQNIVQQFNSTKLLQTLEANNNITEFIASLINDIQALNWDNSSLIMAFFQNGTSQDLNTLQYLLNNWISENNEQNGLYLNYSNTLIKMFDLLFAQTEKPQVIQMLHFFLDFNNGSKSVPFLLSTLENVYDLLHLNNTNSANVLNLYVTQLLHFMSDRQNNQTFNNISSLLHALQKLSFFQTSELRDAALELLPFFEPSSFFNVTSDRSNIVSVLLNLLSRSTVLEEQLRFQNITDGILSLLQLMDNCSTNLEACLSAIAVFENLTMDAADTIANMENGTLNVVISNATVLELEKMTNLQVSLINNIFSIFWNVQKVNHNVSGNFTDVYQEILSVSKLILNITRDLNNNTAQLNFEMLNNYLQPVSVIGKVLSTSNLTESLLQLINIHYDIQCMNQTLLCNFNLTSHLMNFLQKLQLPDPPMEQILVISSIAEYWMGEINTDADMYQQMVSLYEQTKTSLQNQPVLHTILMTLRDISQTIENLKMYNVSLSTVEELILNMAKFNSSNNPIYINNVQLEDAKVQIQVIQWYIMYISNQTLNHNMSSDISALYPLIQFSLANMMPRIQEWLTALGKSNVTELLNMVNHSSHEIDTFYQMLKQSLTTNQTDSNTMSQLLNWIRSSNILKHADSVQGLNTSELTTIWEVVNSIIAGEVNMAKKDELLNIVHTAFASQNITAESDLLQLYDFFLGIINQTHSSVNINMTNGFQISVDCQGVFKILTTVYRMIYNTNHSSLWSNDTLSNLTMDICGLLDWNSQKDWAIMIQSSRRILLHVVPLLPESLMEKFIAADHILEVADQLITETTSTQNKIASIVNIVPLLNNLINKDSNSTNWVGNTAFQKLIYFLLDLVWSYSSPKDILILKTQNFIVGMIQDIQNMVKEQDSSPYTAGLSFALETVEIIINRTQNSSSEDRFLKDIWNSFKQSGMKSMVISTLSQLVLNNATAGSESSNTLNHLIQYVFNITDLIISETSLSSSYMENNTTIKIFQQALGDLLQILPPKNSTQGLYEDLQYADNVTSMLNQLEMFIMKIPGNLSNATILLNLLSELNQTGLVTEITNFIQVTTTSDNIQYGQLFMDALQMFHDFVQMNNTINIQDLSVIFGKYLPIYLETTNNTQSYLNAILELWQNMTDALSSDQSNTILQLLPAIQSHILQNGSTDISNVTSWLVSIISGYIPIAEQERFEKAANASLHLIDAIQACSVNPQTCTHLIGGIQTFVFDVTQLESLIQNRTLSNSSLLQFGSYDQSQIAMINEIFLVLSQAMGHSYNSSAINESGVYEGFLTLKNWLLNATIEDSMNITTPLYVQELVIVLRSANITNLLLQTENLIYTSNCSAHPGTDPLFCNLKIMFQLTQLLQMLPLEQTTHDTLSVVSSIAGQWLSQLNSSISTYQQLIDLYNVTALAFQYQPTFQAINTSLVNIVHILHDMGILNANLNETNIAMNLLSGIIQKAEDEVTIYNISKMSTNDISKLLDIMRLQLDTVNWLMLLVQNQTENVANYPGAHTLQTITQWIANNYQQIHVIIRDAESVVTSLILESPYNTIDALQVMVEDLLNMFLPQNEGAISNETLQTVLKVSQVLVDLSGQNIINQFEMLVKNFSTLIFQSDIANNPTKLFNLLSSINETDVISQIANFIQVVTNSDQFQYGQLLMDALHMFHDFVQMNTTNSMQDLSVIFGKYLPIYLETTNNTQSYFNVILKLWQHLNNITGTLSSDQSNTIMQLLPSIQSHILKNGSTDISNVMSWFVSLISGYIPPTAQDRFTKAANASLHLIDSMQACSVNPQICTHLIGGIQNFLFDVTQLESFIQNRTLSNSSLLQFGSYDQSQIAMINEIFLVLSQAMGHSYNSSAINESGVYEDFLTLKNWLLNTTMEDHVNITTPLYVQELVIVLRSANITNFLLQIENLIYTSNCSAHPGTDPLFCNLKMMFQLTQLLQMLPLEQTTHDTLSVVSSVAGQWISQLNSSISTYQQLIDLYNVTVLALQYQPTFQAINTSLVNIVHLLHDMGILNANFNETDIAMNLLSDIQTAEDTITIYNISSVLQNNISALLETIQLHLQTVNWLIARVKNNPGMFNSSLGAHDIKTIIQSMIDNYQQVSLIIRDSEFIIKSFTSVFNLTDVFHKFNATLQNEQIQGLIYETFTKVSLIGGLLMNANMHKDAEVAAVLMQEMNGINISLILTSIDQVYQTIQGIYGFALDYPLYNNIIAEKMFQIVKDGMGILYDIQIKGAIEKETVYQIYNFTYLLVQDEWKWVPFQNMSAMEAELLDVFYLAMTPFLGGNGSKAYTGNCSAEDVLQILVQTILGNSTVNKSMVNTTCNWQIAYNSSRDSNHTLANMISLALQSSPIYQYVCNRDTLQPLAEEMACLMQVMGLSIGVLADLSNLSGLQIPLIQSLNNSLTFIINNMPNQNFTFHPETQLIQTVDDIFFNQSNPVHLFIQFLIEHYNSTIHTSDLPQTWSQLLKIIMFSDPQNSLNDNIYRLIEAAVNLTMQPSWFHSWQTLNSVLSMNWTCVNTNVSLSVLETLKRAALLINSGQDAQTLQIFKAIVSLNESTDLKVLFDMTNSSLPQCTTTLNAFATFSYSIWTAFDPTHSKLTQDLMSNFSLLACEVLYFQSSNNTWISSMEMIKQMLPLFSNVPVDIADYFAALDKVISLSSDILHNPNISKLDIIGGVYDLFIQELKIFSNNTIITNWIEIIPVRNFMATLLTLSNYNNNNNVTVDQILENDLLYLLSRIFNATSYSQGLSMLSDLIKYLPANANSQIALNSINQIYIQLMTNGSLAEPNSTIMNCVRNMTEDFSNNLSGNLEVANLVQNLFTQINLSANTSVTFELFKQKIYQLQNLTTIVCGMNGSSNAQSVCYMPCQYLTQVQVATDIVKDGLSTSSSDIKLFVENMWQGIQNTLNTQMNSLFPSEYVANLITLLTPFINGTNSNFQAILGNIFSDKNLVFDQLNQKMKLNETSITALLNVPISNNITQTEVLLSIFYQCSTNHLLVAEPLQVYCNLSSEQAYQMALIFLQNVDIYKLTYRLVVPASWQTNFDSILTAIQILTEQIFPLQETYKAVLNNIKPLTDVLFTSTSTSTSTSRRRRSIDLSEISGTDRAATDPFSSMLSNLCQNNITALLRALLSTDTTSMNRNSETALNISKLYDIPSKNPFCLNLFSNLVMTSTGANTWTLLKPLLYGQILYAPNTSETRMIMKETNNSLAQMETYKISMTELYTMMLKIQKYVSLFSNSSDAIGGAANFLNNSAISSFLDNFLQVNSTELLTNITSIVTDMMNLNVNNTVPHLTTLSSVLSNLLSCMATDRIKVFNSVSEMKATALQLQQTNELFAAVTFDLPSGGSRQKRDVSSGSGLPKNIKYTISMRSALSESTFTLRDSNWVPGPHNTLNKYSRGFVYLQENIERAIVKLQTNISNETLANIGVQYQPMPYPCYNKDSFLYSMSFTLPIAMMITWVLFIAAFVKKLVHEKELRLHEYMKMMGVNSSNHFFAWFIESAVFLIFSSGIIAIILKYGKILSYSNGFILFIFLLDYSLTVIALSYLISVFFHNTNVAALSGSLIYIIAFFPFIVVVSKETDLSFAVKTLLSIFSPTALSYGTQYIVRFEEKGEGIQWSNLYNSPVLNDTFSFGWLLWVMLIDSMIYFIVGCYIRFVFPGKYGIGAVWYFPFLPSFWIECCGLQNLCSKKPSGLLMSNIVEHGMPEKKGDGLYPQNEQEPTDLNVGVSLRGLTKAYNDKMAVQNLNLNFYEGHITALLGHNGAGKTTTLSMLMGLFSPTSGTINVYGDDIRTRLEKVRKSMGVCMQYDALFDHLTTKEHLLLYGSIKAPQWNKSQLHSEVKRTLKETGLYNHRHKPVMTLSGGMKRKLSICIAMIGGSKVIILDEPTTGVDPCSRRSIWEVISKNKTDKTIILSTHHLDEAEVLSDRIAFLEQGGLRCCGTPLFLKEKFGSGYHLTITKKFPNQNDVQMCDPERVTTLIQSHIPEATLKEDIGGELVYVLPPFRAEISNGYLSLLRDLDTNMNDLHIGCYGISDTTIEEVFLKLIDGLDKDDQQLTNNAIPIPGQENLLSEEMSTSNFYSPSDSDDQPLTEKDNVKGCKLLLKKITAIWIKRFHNSKRNWKGLLSQILLPVLFVIAAMGLGSLSMSTVDYPELLLSPDLYGTTDQSVPFGLYNKSSEDLMNAMNSFPGIDNACLDQNSQCLLKDSLGSWNTTGNMMIINSYCNCSSGYQVCLAPDAVPPHRKTYSGQMMYNITGIDMEKYLLQTTLSFIQQRYGGWSFGIPTSDINIMMNLSSLPPNMNLNKVWYNNEGPHSLPAYLNSFSNFLLRSNLPSNESADYSISVSTAPLPGAVSQPTSTSILVNTLVALSVLVGYSITTSSFVTYIVKEYDNGSKRLQHIAGVGEACYWVTNLIYDMTVYLIPVALSMGMIAAFKLPAFYDYPNLAGVSILFILFGYSTFTWMYLIAGTFKNAGMAFITYVCINLFIGINTIISSSVVYMLLQAKTDASSADYQSLNNTYNNLINFFKIFPQFCFGYGLIELSQQQAIRDQLAIYGTSETVNVFSMDILGYMFVAMIIQGTFCFILRLLICDGIIYSVKSFFKKAFNMYPNFVEKDPEEDEDVILERERVQSNKANEDLLLLKGVTKMFHQVNKKVIAVNNMSLGVPPGECFGLLGVNGAGKTTTFKMLTGDISPSSGKIQVRNHKGDLVNVLGFNTDWSSFGYCPQEDALDGFMTGEEHLYYYARIHGIPEKKIKAVSNQLLQKLQLVQYKDRITENYSCGTRRKLSTALALIGKPSILLLDEPSSGMDPKTKRHLWKVIAEEVQNKCSVVLTSHSMEECEALCTRLAIMVKGKFQCIGSLQQIKSRFGSGFTVKMHIKDSSVSIEAITDFMHLHFPNTYIKEQHFTMVEYHVPVSAGGVANIFELLESNKIALNIIHFSVSQTTLDEVFINFAQSQSSPDNSSLSSQEIEQIVVT